VPALARGQWVVCDRFTDATYAYQGGGPRRVARVDPRARAARAWRLQSDLTLLFDVPTAVVARAPGAARARRAARSTSSSAKATGFFERVRDAYLELAAAEPARFRVIDSSQPLAAVRADLAQALDF
jgi:dTMP kinase